MLILCFTATEFDVMQDATNDRNIDGKLIDVEKVFQDKSPRIARKIPLFIYNYLKRVVHQDELNDAINRFSDRKGLDFVRSILDYMGANITHQGITNIPEIGRASCRERV